jgi:hypothetical protein
LERNWDEELLEADRETAKTLGTIEIEVRRFVEVSRMTDKDEGAISTTSGKQLDDDDREIAEKACKKRDLTHGSEFKHRPFDLSVQKLTLPVQVHSWGLEGIIAHHSHRRLP